MQTNPNCNCNAMRPDYSMLNALPLAMGYVPEQTFKKTYDKATALSMGTIFPELCKPFCGKGGACL